jgi:hypothetical protein
MSIAFLYGKKFVGPITPTILALRDELYSLPYDKIDWNKARNTCAKVYVTILCIFSSKHILPLLKNCAIFKYK